MTVTTEFSGFLSEEDAREHSELPPAFSDEPEAGADPEAPWGRKADGTPKAKPGRPAGTPDSRPRTRTAQRRARVAPAAPKPKQQRAKAKGPAMPDYRPGLRGILQILAAPLALVGIKNPAFAADAAAVTVHAEGLVEAAQETAEQQPAFAAVLDRVLAVGPWGALLGAGMPLVVQVCANHGLLPPEMTAAMGAQSPQELLAQVEAEAA